MNLAKLLQHLEEITNQFLPGLRWLSQLPTSLLRLSQRSPTSVSTLSEAQTMINIIAIQSVLQSFVSDIPDIQGVTLVSPDGLAIASALPERVDEERVAAMTAAMLSIGERIGRELARGQVERVIVVGEKGYSVLVNCSDDAVLLILANANVKQGLLFLEIKRAVAELTPLLTEQPKANLLT
jgi:uncharacterized protein